MDPHSPLSPVAIDAMPSLAKILIIYGPLGVLALIGCIVAVKLYRDNQRDRETFAAQLKLERDDCERERKELQAQLASEREEYTEELKKLEERYIAKTETQLEKYHQLAQSLNQVLDSAFKHRPR